MAAKYNWIFIMQGRQILVRSKNMGKQLLIELWLSNRLKSFQIIVDDKPKTKQYIC